MDWIEDDRKEASIAIPDTKADFWSVLIVDDEEDIHLATKITMKNFVFEGKKIKFTSAYSADEAKSILLTSNTFGLILLDVVMENDNAGLDLAQYIRHEIKNTYTRIILRTGQPGIAPEQSVIRNFDIDGYKAKTELRHHDLETIFYTSLRAYRDICHLQKHRKILTQVISSITNLSEIGNLSTFASGVLEQLKLVLNISTTSMLIDAPESFGITQMDNQLQLFSGSHSDIKLITYKNIDALEATEKALFKKALSLKANFYENNHYVTFHQSGHGYSTIFAFETTHELDIQERKMIDLFLKNVLLSYENLLLNRFINETQELTITLMGGTMESRSKETGEHVIRVGLYAKTLAGLMGESAVFCEKIRLAAQLHDIGKVGVPDRILNKPSKLDSDEWEEMKLHTVNGWKVLKDNNNSIIDMGANLALDHHEKWDGTGYPNGKKENEISLEGRITAIADVFDALCSKRCYKEAWSIEAAKSEIAQGAGNQFDPALVKLFEQHFPLFEQIIQNHPD